MRGRYVREYSEHPRLNDCNLQKSCMMSDAGVRGQASHYHDLNYDLSIKIIFRLYNVCKQLLAVAEVRKIIFCVDNSF